MTSRWPSWARVGAGLLAGLGAGTIDVVAEHYVVATTGVALALLWRSSAPSFLAVLLGSVLVT
ncbi:MAG: hypothetical protein KDA28_00080, partial [Phycisphaerales bacterium]|nr:hypothetical protein [Phycisphaerales bacterium]